ncbi:MAG: homoserine dehydrogenase [Planctomycetaceae bacterium]
MSLEPIKVGMIGLGTVGGGVARLLLEEKDRITRRSGRPVELVRVAVQDTEKERDIAVPDGVLTNNVDDIVNDPEIQVAIQLMGGSTNSQGVMESLLRAGKDVVTANKALLCIHGVELFRLANELGRTISFEAAVAGGVPVINSVAQSMTANQLSSIEGILNGTSNFILTQMLSAGISYAEALSQAQELGYAEADPTMDVDGTDAAQKLVILVQLAFGTRVELDAFPRQGLESLALADLKFASEMGYKIKLLAVARLVGGELEMHVQPTLLRKDRILATTDGPLNSILLEGDAVGPIWLSGAGAGRMPTASAVVSDLVSVITGRSAASFPHLEVFDAKDNFKIQSVEEISRRYYLRFNVDDRPHVLATLTEILGRHKISIATVIQHEAPEPERQPDAAVPLVFMTHRTTEGAVRAAMSEFQKLDCLGIPIVCLPVAD